MCALSAIGCGHPFQPWRLRFLTREFPGIPSQTSKRRWEADVIAQDPQLVSVKIGINDVWHALTGAGEGSSLERFRDTYAEILGRLRTFLSANHDRSLRTDRHLAARLRARQRSAQALCCHSLRCCRSVRGAWSCASSWHLRKGPLRSAGHRLGARWRAPIFLRSHVDHPIVACLPGFAVIFLMHSVRLFLFSLVFISLSHAADPVEFSVGDFVFARPASWSWITPASPMRKAQLSVPAQGGAPQPT